MPRINLGVFFSHFPNGNIKYDYKKNIKYNDKLHQNIREHIFLNGVTPSLKMYVINTPKKSMW